MEVETACPACGEPLTLLVDVSAGRRQSYVEDCEVCCRPMLIEVTVYGHDEVDLAVRSTDD